MSFIAAGLGIAGLSEAALTVAAGEAIGAGVGALTNPKDRLKGALFGGLTGAAGGALGAGIGALGGAASGAVDAGAAATADEAANATANAAGNIGKGAAQAAGTTGPQTLTDVASSMGTTPAATVGTPAAQVAAPVADSGSVLSNAVSSPITKAATPQLMNMAGSMMNPTPTYDNSGQQKINEAKAQGQQDAYQVYKGWAHGGSIRLENNSFIIPADVVSAIGNGSTKAGAKYLDHLFASLAAGPAPKAGSLAKQRAKERRQA